MSTTLYDGAMKILETIVVEYRKEKMTDADIVDSLEYTKKILKRIPILTQNAKDTLNRAIDNTIKELKNQK